MKIGKITTIIMMLMLTTIAITALSQTAEGKSLYAIANINQRPTPINAYDIQPNGSLVYQATHSVPYQGSGGVGLAIDSNAGIIFVTYENSNTIELVNATTMTSEGSTTAPGATNLAGIVVDHDKNKVYTVDRDTKNLYTYDWNPVNTTLYNPQSYYLSSINRAYGIALDEVHDLLYIGDRTPNVRYYHTSNWTEMGYITVSQDVMGIALDTMNGYIYTGNAYPPFGSTGILCKYDLNTDTETTFDLRAYTNDINDNVVGLSVDQDKHNLYVTTGNQASGGSDKIIMFDSNLNPLNQTDDIGDPTGLTIPTQDISYNPLSLEKTDDVQTCISPDQEFMYSICFNNLENENPVTNVVIKDSLPAEVDFVSASDNGAYDAMAHTVTWDIGTLDNGAPNQCVTITVSVKSDTVPATTITNQVTIDSDDTPPTTQTEQTLVCEGDDGDVTPPSQTVELGKPLMEDVYYTGLEYLDLIGSQTPVWINSTDPESGTEYIKYKLFKSDEFGEWNDPDWVYVYDNDQTGDPATSDSDPTVGSISIKFTIQESCFHQIHAHCINNEGIWSYSDPLDFLVDYDAPLNNQYTYFGDYLYPNGARFISNQTIKRIYANDTGCTGGVAGVDRIVWRIENYQTQTIASGVVYDNDTTIYDDQYVYVSGDLDMTEGKMVIDIQLKQECRHFIYHQAIDKLENMRSGRKQQVNVDITPPNITKIVGMPHCVVIPEKEYCITDETMITFNASDEGCMGGVGLDTLAYRIWNMSHGWTNWTYVDGETSISIDEECTHYLEIKAMDLLGNWIIDNETFHVDLLPPIIEKTVGDPNCGPYWANPDLIPMNYSNYYGDGTDSYCVTTQTEINLNAIDQGCCTSSLMIEYKMWKADEEEPETWTTYTGNFTFDEECMHYLLVRAYDCLENGKETMQHWDLEIFYVDDSEPMIHKTIGDPNCTIIPNQEYCITSDTPIIINASNVGCCPSEILMLRYKINDDEWVMPMLPAIIYLPEECTHTLTIEAWDCLGNKATDVETFHVDNSHPELNKTVGDPNCPQYMDCTMLEIPESGTIEMIKFLGDFAYFDALVSDIPMGYDIINGYYRAWCVDQNHTISPGVEYDVDFYCSYEEEIPWPDDDWDLVNYIINHKHPEATVMDIQEAIWRFINGGEDPSTAIGQSMVENATLYGEGFIPTQGQYCAILCDTGNETQKTFIEFRVPEVYCVTTETEITLDAMDYPGCCTEDVMIEYKMWAADEPMPESWTTYTSPVNFTEECKHYLLVRVYDCLGHGMDDPIWDLEIFYVDDTAPEIDKTVGFPNCVIIEDQEYCVTTKTPITIGAENVGCCKDDNITIRYKINDGEWIYLWEYPVDIYFEEECNHTLTIEAFDCLGNTARDVELFHVDDTAPEIIKIVGEPNCGPYCEVPEYLPQEYTLVPNDEQYDFVSGFVRKSMDEENITFEIFLGETGSRQNQFQLVFSEYQGDGIHTLPRNSKWKIGWMPGVSTEEPMMGYNDGPEPPHPKYGYWAGGSHESLPEDITIIGNMTDFYYKVIIPRYYFGECGDKYYWAVTVGEDWEEESTSTEFAQYPGPDVWKKWQCSGMFEPNMNGIESYCVNLSTEITLDTFDPGCCQSNITIEYFIIKPQSEVIPGKISRRALPQWKVYNGTPIQFEEECKHYLIVRAYDCLGNGRNMHYWDMEIFYVDEQGPNVTKVVHDPKVKLEDDSQGHDQWMIFPETDICFSVNESSENGCCPNEEVTIEYRYWYLGEWTDWMTYEECVHLTEGCVHYLEARAVDCLGNYGATDNETFWVCGPSGDSGPDVKFIEPMFGETRCDRTLEVIIEATDDETAKEDLNVIMWIPGGRRDAPTLYYYPEYDPIKYGDEYFHAFIDIYKYQDGADLTLEVVAQDEDMNTERADPPQQFKVCSTIVWDQWMQKGWNKLVLPFDGVSCSYDMKHVLASVYDHVKVVYHYDGIGWATYKPSAPVHPWTTFDTGETYWVYITKEDGLRYYTDTHAPTINIDYPANGEEFDCETLAIDIWGYASDVETGIKEVSLNIMDNDTGEYWTGSTWGNYTEHICDYDQNTDQWTCMGTKNIMLTDGQEIIVTATAWDNAGCMAETMNVFTYVCEPVEECIPDVTYTTNADFAMGTLTNTYAEEDALYLNTTASNIYPTLWIANAGEDSLSKWDTTTNKEVARYHTWFGELGDHGSWTGPAPSRTCVDSEGNCYVANRDFSSLTPDVIKVYTDDWVDRNGDGFLNTSYDEDGNGQIEPDEMLPMTDSNFNGIIDDDEIVDERIAWATQVGSGGKGRSLAIDLEGNIWLGLYDTNQYYKIDSNDGSILGGPYSVSPNTPYGALVDKHGYLWGSSLTNNLLKMNTSDPTDYTTYYVPDTYGIALGYDSLDNTIVYCGGNSPFVIFNSSTETYSYPDSFSSALGVAVDSQGDIVTGSSSTGAIAKYSPNGSIIWQVSGQVYSEVRGIVFDADDNIWAIHRDMSKLCKYNGANGSYLGIYDAGLYPYTYSDATGIGFSSSVSSGKWTIIHDSEAAGTMWNKVDWNAGTPTDTNIIVKVRSSEDQVSWSPWETATNGGSLMSTPNGQYIQMEVTMQTTSEESPVIYDISIDGSCADCMNIVETAVDKNPEEFNTLVEAVLAAGLDGVLSNLSQEFTVFAPIDDAFAEIDPVVLQDLVENDTANLTKILTYHVVPGTYLSTDLFDGMTLSTVQGDNLTITINGSGVFVNDAMVILPDVICCNGVIHAIDTVLFPPECLNIVERAVAENPEEFNTLVEAVLAAGLDGVLANESKQYTVFAPTDAAFSLLDPQELAHLLDNDTENLTEILLYHVVPGIYTSGDLYDGMNLTTAQGSNITITIDGDVYINDHAMVTQPDLVCCNGVIHIIDKVLVPTEEEV